jgi:hypothetical protein
MASGAPSEARILIAPLYTKILENQEHTRALERKIDDALSNSKQACNIVDRTDLLENNVQIVSDRLDGLVNNLGSNLTVDYVQNELKPKLDELKQQMKLMVRMFIAMLVTLSVVLVAVGLAIVAREPPKAEPVELGSEYCKWYHNIPWSETMPHHAVQHALTWTRCAADSFMPPCCRPGFS